MSNRTPQNGFLPGARPNGCEGCGGYVHPMPLGQSPRLCVPCREELVAESVSRGLRELERFLEAAA